MGSMDKMAARLYNQDKKSVHPDVAGTDIPLEDTCILADLQGLLCMLVPVTMEMLKETQNEGIHPIRFYSTHTFIEPPPGTDVEMLIQEAKLVTNSWQRPKYNADCFALQDTSPVRLFGKAYLRGTKISSNRTNQILFRSPPVDKLKKITEDTKRAIYKMRCKITTGEIRDILEEVETLNHDCLQYVRKIEGVLPAKKKGNILEFQRAYDQYKQMLKGINHHVSILKISNKLETVYAFDPEGFTPSEELQNSVKYSRRNLDDVLYILTKYYNDIEKAKERRKTNKNNLSAHTVALMLEADSSGEEEETYGA